MKKFRIMSALAAAALLTGCSSDAPDAPNPDGNRTTPDNGEVMYMALRINTPAETRADDDKFGADGGEKLATATENHIKDVSVFIYGPSDVEDDSSTEKLLWAGKADLNAEGVGTDANKPWSTTAKFQVSKSTFGELTARTTKTLHFYVLCNADADLATDYRPETEVSSAYLSDDNYFVMSGYEDLEINAKPGDNDKVDASNPWIISTGAVHVDRLASRQDYTYAAKGEGINYPLYTSASEHMDFLMYGSCMNNEGENQLYFLRSWDSTNNKAIFPTTLFNSTVTGSYFYENAGTTVAALRLDRYDENGETGVDDYTLTGTKYALPRTNQKAAGTAKISDLAYFSFRTEFKPNTDGLLDSDPTQKAIKTKLEKMDGQNKVYAIRGNYIGTFLDFATYTGPNSDLVKSIYNDAISQGVTATNAALDAWYEVAANKATLVNDEGLFQYSPDDEGKYFCYYYKPVYDSDAENIADGQKYALVRNHLYDVKINGISMIGYPGDYIPTDIDPKYNDYWFSMTITVNPWQVRQNHFSF